MSKSTLVNRWGLLKTLTTAFPVIISAISLVIQVGPYSLIFRLTYPNTTNILWKHYRLTAGALSLTFFFWRIHIFPISMFMVAWLIKYSTYTDFICDKHQINWYDSYPILSHLFYQSKLKIQYERSTSHLPIKLISSNLKRHKRHLRGT